ncbi:MAG: winged helix-turn-helix transcriptional regulator [Gammaproteobacteria bacterium]|nr:winged helix-turn-helix transcriptional regulator [Gammaproteobacteria bacterium]
MTDREQQILALVREDPMISQQAIARRLGITRSSVAGHIMKLTKKGAIKGRAYVLGAETFVIAIGGANIDIHGKPAAALQLRDSNPGFVTMSAGGVARNVAEVLANLAIDCRLIAAVGDDEQGQRIIDEGQQSGIDMQHVVRIGGARTSVYLSILDQTGDMHVAINDMAVTDGLTVEHLRTHAQLLQESALVIIDANVPGTTLEWLAENTAGKTVFADTVSVAKAPRLNRCLASIHTLKTNRAEVAALTSSKANTRKQLESAAGRLHGAGVQRVFVTLGDEGVFYSTGAQMAVIRPGRRRRKVANSGGAGDAFLAGLVCCWLDGLSLTKSIRYSMTLAEEALQSDTTIRPQNSPSQRVGAGHAG